jgi:hypothetical protein
VYKAVMSERLRRWGRRALVVIAAALGCVNLLGALPFFQDSGWSNERTILYAAEGGLMSPREALMNTVLFLVGALIWFLVFCATVAPPNSRARLAFRAAYMGTILVGGLSVGAGALCGDVGGRLVVGVIAGLPMALVAGAVRPWGMQSLRAQNQ